MASRKIRVKTLPKTAPTVEELERRNHVFAQILSLRDSMEPLGFSAVDLIREGREEHRPPHLEGMPNGTV